MTLNEARRYHPSIDYVQGSVVYIFVVLVSFKRTTAVGCDQASAVIATAAVAVLDLHKCCQITSFV